MGSSGWFCHQIWSQGFTDVGYHHAMDGHTSESFSIWPSSPSCAPSCTDLIPCYSAWANGTPGGAWIMSAHQIYWIHHWASSSLSPVTVIPRSYGWQRWRLTWYESPVGQQSACNSSTAPTLWPLITLHPPLAIPGDLKPSKHSVKVASLHPALPTEPSPAALRRCAAVFLQVC